MKVLVLILLSMSVLLANGERRDIDIKKRG